MPPGNLLHPSGIFLLGFLDLFPFPGYQCRRTTLTPTCLKIPAGGTGKKIVQGLVDGKALIDPVNAREQESGRDQTDSNHQDVAAVAFAPGEQSDADHLPASPL